MRSFGERMFPRDKARRQPCVQFAAFQMNGEIHINCRDAGDPKRSECMDACRQQFRSRVFTNRCYEFLFTHTAAAFDSQLLRPVVKFLLGAIFEWVIRIAGSLRC